jgi:hypothetical protein
LALLSVLGRGVGYTTLVLLAAVTVGDATGVGDAESWLCSHDSMVLLSRGSSKLTAISVRTTTTIVTMMR